MKNILLFFSCLVILGCGSKTSDNGQETSENSGPKLVWSDEFDYEGLPDPAKWNYEEGMLRNNEAQFYTREDERNARVRDGFLTIEARKDEDGRAAYSSASLITFGKKTFRYGRIEVRAKVPVGKGTWPAIWMLGENIGEVDWPACGEIDIMENVGFDSLRVHGNIHTEAFNHVKNTNKGNSILVEKPWETFHVYSVDWRADSIQFFVDDQKYFTYVKPENATLAEWPFDNPHYLILNLAIGGGWGGQQGIDDSRFPHQFIIDYVRVYE